MYPYYQLLLRGVSKIRAIPRTPLVQISSKHIHFASRISSDLKLPDVQGVEAMYPTILKELSTNHPCKDIPTVTKHITEVVNYYSPGSSIVYMLSLMDSYRCFAATPPSEENIRLVQIMAWCLELVRTHIILVDDIIDNSPIRRNRPAWLIVGDNNAAELAANDAVILEHCIYSLFNTHFRDKLYYLDLMDTIDDILKNTAVGQFMESEIERTFRSTKNLDIFTRDRHRNLIKYKASPTSWEMQVIVGMQMNNVRCPEIFREVYEFMWWITESYQYLDDYLDCFGTKKGNFGSDVQNGQMTWLIITAWERANPQQKSILQEYYGTPGKENIAAVMKVYNELGIKDLFKRYYNEEFIPEMKKRIQQLSEGVPKQIFINILERGYIRTL